jgi:HSP20 family protein
MAKNDKGKQEIALTKDKSGKEAASPPAPTQTLAPFRAWENEIERMFEDFPFFRIPRFRELEAFRFPRELRPQVPSLDMYEEKSDVVVKAEMPGMSKDDIDIVLSDSTLTLKGEKKKEEEVKEKDYYRCERQYGSFLRSVKLPSEVKAEGVRATFKDGVLEVRLPKSEQAKKKEVRVQVQ